MKKITLNEKDYIIGSLDAFGQLHVARKVAPVINTMGLSIQNLVSQGRLVSDSPDPTVQLEIMSASMNVIAHMSEEDVDYVVLKCLAVVRRVDKTTGQALPIMNGKVFLYQDIQLTDMIQLSINVVMENLSNFFPLLRAVSASQTSSEPQDQMSS